jgi:hypothetical protein
MKVYGRRSARRTIHMRSFLAFSQPLGPAEIRLRIWN